MKRCLDIIYKDVHINTHVYIQWNLRTMDKLGVRHLSFVERLSYLRGCHLVAFLLIQPSTVLCIYIYQLFM